MWDWRILVITAAIFLSCEDYSKDSERINFQGLSTINDLEIGTTGISIDSIAFASSKIRYLLTGHFIMDGEEEFFTIYFDQHPLNPEAKVDVFNFDSKLLNDEFLSCVINIENNVCEITWTGVESRIYLKDRISGGH